MSNLEFYRKI